MRHRTSSTILALAVAGAAIVLGAVPAGAASSGGAILTGGVKGQSSGGTAQCTETSDGAYVYELNGFSAGGSTWDLSVTVSGTKRVQKLTPTSASGVTMSDSAGTSLYLSDTGVVKVGKGSSSVKAVATMSDQSGSGADTKVVLDLTC